jgi:hypothetical protein
MSRFSTPAPMTGATPLRIVRDGTDDSRYSCRGLKPYGKQSTAKRLPRSGLTVEVVVLAWADDPRGECGVCPACTAIRWPNGVWAALDAED